MASDPAPTSTPDDSVPSDAHKLAATRLVTIGHRYTANRRQLVEILLRSDGPLSIAGILACDGRLAQSSAYRNLVVLESAGVVHRIVTSDDHARFELSEDITGEHHHHLICDRCGLIHDVVLPSDVEHALEQALVGEAVRLSFAGHHHRVDLVGRCRDCVADSDDPAVDPA